MVALFGKLFGGSSNTSHTKVDADARVQFGGTHTTVYSPNQSRRWSLFGNGNKELLQKIDQRMTQQEELLRRQADLINLQSQLYGKLAESTKVLKADTEKLQSGFLKQKESLDEFKACSFSLAAYGFFTLRGITREEGFHMRNLYTRTASRALPAGVATYMFSKFMLNPPDERA